MLSELSVFYVDYLGLFRQIVRVCLLASSLIHVFSVQTTLNAHLHKQTGDAKECHAIFRHNLQKLTMVAHYQILRRACSFEAVRLQ